MISRRCRRILLAILLVLLGLGLSYFLFVGPGRPLGSERDQIERKFVSLLTLIERHAADPVFSSENYDYLRSQELYDEIERAIPEGLILHAGWSLDGHHGSRSLFVHEGWQGHVTYDWVTSTREDGRYVLRRGKSEEGDRLLVFEGRIPNAHKRVFRIAFFENEVLKYLEIQ